MLDDRHGCSTVNECPYRCVAKCVGQWWCLQVTTECLVNWSRGCCLLLNLGLIIIGAGDSVVSKGVLRIRG